MVQTNILTYVVAKQVKVLHEEPTAVQQKRCKDYICIDI